MRHFVFVGLALVAACSSGDPDPTGDGTDMGDTGQPGDGAADTDTDEVPTDTDPTLTIAERMAAASATAENHALCVAVKPFYWEIGDASEVLGHASVDGSGDTTYTADSVMAIASASKWVYSTYYVQRVAGVLTAEDIEFFNFWSGYTDFTGCDQDASVQSCLDQKNPNGTTNGTFEADTQNKFQYGGGHMQKHAALRRLGDMKNAALATEILSQIGTDIVFGYSEPQPAGGGYTSAANYAKMLRKILTGDLLMKDALGTHPVCVDPTTCPLALGSPSPAGEAFHYSIGHWVEDDPDDGDGAFSSAGAFGFYPWIDATKTLYGIVARRASPGSGFDSLDCGRLIRKAWVTGVEVR